MFKPANSDNYNYNSYLFHCRMEDYFDVYLDDDPTHGVYYIDFLDEIKENYYPGFLQFMGTYGEIITDDEGNIIDHCDSFFLGILYDYINSDQIIRDHLKYGIGIINSLDRLIGKKPSQNLETVMQGFNRAVKN